MVTPKKPREHPHLAACRAAAAKDAAVSSVRSPERLLLLYSAIARLLLAGPPFRGPRHVDP